MVLVQPEVLALEFGNAAQLLSTDPCWDLTVCTESGH